LQCDNKIYDIQGQVFTDVPVGKLEDLLLVSITTVLTVFMSVVWIIRTVSNKAKDLE
jgi:PIG-X / PBN1.